MARAYLDEILRIRSSPAVKHFCAKFAGHVESGDIPAGVVLVNNATKTGWFHSVAAVISGYLFFLKVASSFGVRIRSPLHRCRGKPCSTPVTRREICARVCVIRTRGARLESTAITQLRKHKDAISNELDQLLSGIAPRGCSFTDVNAPDFHDDPTNRFLMMELKRPGEALSRGQGLALAALAHEPRITVWYVQFWANGEHGQIAWADFRAFNSIEYLTVDQFRARVDAWWKNRYRFTGTSDVAYTAQSWFENDGR